MTSIMESFLMKNWIIIDVDLYICNVVIPYTPS
jgi:hypothetical protein